MLLLFQNFLIFNFLLNYRFKFVVETDVEFVAVVRPRAELEFDQYDNNNNNYYYYCYYYYYYYYCREPNLSLQDCVSNGKLVMSIWHVDMNIAGGIHITDP